MADGILDGTGETYSINEFSGNGSTTDWSISFAGGYIYKSHVKAFIRSSTGVETVTDFTWIGDLQVRVTPAVPTGSTLVVYRDTPKDEPTVNFTDGAIINEPNLDMLAKQAVFVAAEVLDRFGTVEGGSQLAIEIANQAIGIANGAVATANTATGIASGAVTTANGAVTIANGAVVTANEAKGIANDTAAQFAQLKLDVEQIIGLDLSAFVKRDVPNTFTGTQTFNSAIVIGGTSTNVSIAPAGTATKTSGGMAGTAFDLDYRPAVALKADTTTVNSLDAQNVKRTGEQGMQGPIRFDPLGLWKIGHGVGNGVYFDADDMALRVPGAKTLYIQGGSGANTIATFASNSSNIVFYRAVAGTSAAFTGAISASGVTAAGSVVGGTIVSNGNIVFPSIASGSARQIAFQFTGRTTYLYGNNDGSAGLADTASGGVWLYDKVNFIVHRALNAQVSVDTPIVRNGSGNLEFQFGTTRRAILHNGGVILYGSGDGQAGGVSNGGLVIQTSATVASNQFSHLGFGTDAQGGTPIARVSMQVTGSGSRLLFGTSNNFSSGVTNTALGIDPDGSVGIGGALSVGGNVVLGGTSGLSWSSFGGFWNMIDTSYIRTNKGVAAIGEVYSATAFTMGAFGSWTGTGIGIGTTSPIRGVHLANQEFVMENTGSSANQRKFRMYASAVSGWTRVTMDILNDAGSAASKSLGYVDGASGELFWTANGNFNDVYIRSDRRLKEDSRELGDYVGCLLDKVPVYEGRKAGEVGFYVIADEVDQVFPELVTTPDNPDEYQNVNYLGFIPLIMAELKTLRKRVKELEDGST